MEKNKKILIVEDEAVITWNLARIIEKSGCGVCATSRTYESALEAFFHHAPDVVLVDIVLAGEKNGLDLAQEILKIRYVPIICITAYSTGAYILRIREMSIFGYMIKPIDEKELCVMMHLALNQSERSCVIALEQRQKEATIEHLGNYFRTLADTLPFLLIDFSDNGEVFYANTFARHILALPSDAPVFFNNIFSAESPAKHCYQSCLEGKTHSYKILHCKDEKKFNCWHLSFWMPITLPEPTPKKGVRFLSIMLQDWLDHLLLPRERLWEHYHLSSREIDILRGILQGKRIQTIAKENFVSLPTVKYHINQLYNKMGVNDREQLYQILQEKILADMPPDVFFAYIFTSIVPLVKK